MRPRQLELDLEQRVKTVFDWKELIPMAGIYFSIRNEQAGKPTVGANPKGNEVLWWGLFAHHFNAYAWTATGIVIGAHEAYYRLKDCFSYFN